MAGVKMKFKWKRAVGGMYRSDHDEYEAMIQKNINGFGIWVRRNFAGNKIAVLEDSMWSEDLKFIPTLSLAKQKAEEFAKQLSKLEM